MDQNEQFLVNRSIIFPYQDFKIIGDSTKVLGDITLESALLQAVLLFIPDLIVLKARCSIFQCRL